MRGKNDLWPTPERGRAWYKEAMKSAQIKARGGKRKGAGRKPRPVAREAVTVRLEPEHAERFRRLCEAKGRSQAEQLTEWIKRARVATPAPEPEP